MQLAALSRGPACRRTRLAPRRTPRRSGPRLPPSARRAPPPLRGGAPATLSTTRPSTHSVVKHLADESVHLPRGPSKARRPALLLAAACSTHAPGLPAARSGQVAQVSPQRPRATACQMPPLLLACTRKAAARGGAPHECAGSRARPRQHRQEANDRRGTLYAGRRRPRAVRAGICYAACRCRGPRDAEAGPRSGTRPWGGAARSVARQSGSQSGVVPAEQSGVSTLRTPPDRLVSSPLHRRAEPLRHGSLPRMA